MVKTQMLKDYLVGLGPDNAMLRTILRLNACVRGYQVRFCDRSIVLRRGCREVVLSKGHYVQVPTVMGCFDQLFDAIEPEQARDRTVLDFSAPRLHRYARSQVAFYFPAIPEEDQMEVYTSSYLPQPGDVVWDVGAHAGATTYFLSRVVGPHGKVYAFEPDTTNYEYLKKNIELHGLRNVVPVAKALSGSTGTASFNMDGTMCAGLREYALYKVKGGSKAVPTITVEDACSELGDVPRFVKMDIEGAEVAAIEGSLEFLKSHPVNFAIESYHRINGELTYKALERLFSKIGYNVRSSGEFGQMFTWAAPPL